MPVDYSLYLVTVRDLLPPDISYLQSLENALAGGVTVVQVREKTVDTGEFLEIAQQTKALCAKYHVPLIINDRVDIALAVEADGVHLGQTDMPIQVARKLLPPHMIIGISCSTVDQLKKAVADGADYVGIGSIYATETKKLTSSPLGVRAVGEFLEYLDDKIKAVVIGGINTGTLTRTLFGCVSTSGRTLDGVAVGSAIFASSEPLVASKKLKGLLSTFRQSSQNFSVKARYTVDSIKAEVAKALIAVKELSPLVHQITNTVVSTQSANATLALGASPIMATSPEEMEDLAKVPGGLLINFGTIQNKDGMLLAGRYANLNKKPVVFDPVGIGATSFRRTTANELLNAWQATVIKGNAAEIGALAKSSEVLSKGVDSAGIGFADPASVIRELALKERCIIALTGVTDWITDGVTVVKLSNGHRLLGDITGSGCMVGTAVATFCGAMSMAAKSQPVDRSNGLVDGDMFVATVAGLLAVTIASEAAGSRSDVQGPGTFLDAFIDELSKLTPTDLHDKAKFEIV